MESSQSITPSGGLDEKLLDEESKGATALASSGMPYTCNDYFPAVQQYPDDDEHKENFWWTGAKAWDKMIPRKIKMPLCDYVICTVGNHHVRLLAESLREMPQKRFEYKWNPDTKRVVTKEEMHREIVLPQKKELSKQWQCMCLAEVDQRVQRHECETRKLFDPEHGNSGLPVTFAEMRARLGDGVSSEQLLEHWDRLDSQPHTYMWDDTRNKVMTWDELLCEIVDPANREFETRWRSLTEATTQQRLERLTDYSKDECSWDHRAGKWVTFEEVCKEFGKGQQVQALRRWDSLVKVNREPLPLGCAVGPAVPIAFRALKLTWLLFLLVPLPSYEVSYCVGGNATAFTSWMNETLGIQTMQDEHNNTGIMYRLFGIHTQPYPGQAVYPTKLVWPLLILYLLCLIREEWKILQYVVIPQVQTTNGFAVFGRPVGFYFWLVFAFSMSFISHLDLVTNGLFVATSWTMVSCDFGPKVNCIWTETMQASMFRLVPVPTVTNGHFKMASLTETVDIPFQWLVFFLWVFMFTQALWGWIGAQPLLWVYHKCIKGSCLEPLYRYCEKKNKWKSWGLTDEVRKHPDRNQYMTKQEMHQDDDGKRSPEELERYWANEMQKGSHQTTEEYLSERIDYTSRNDEFVKHFIEGGPGHTMIYQTYFDETHRSFTDHGTALISLADSCRMYTITSMNVQYSKNKVSYYLNCKGDQGPAYGIMKRVLQTNFYKVALSGFLQNGVQINLQVTLFAMITLLEKNASEDEDWALSRAIFHINAQVLFSICIGLCVMFRNFLEGIQLFWWIRDIMQKDVITDEHEFSKILNRKFLMFKIALFMYAGIMVYAFFKLIAVFHCKDSMWNLWACACISPAAQQGSCDSPTTCEPS